MEKERHELVVRSGVNPVVLNGVELGFLGIESVLFSGPAISLPRALTSLNLIAGFWRTGETGCNHSTKRTPDLRWRIPNAGTGLDGGKGAGVGDGGQ